MAAELEAAQPAVVAAVAEVSVQQGHGRRSAAQCFAGVRRLAAADAPLSLGSVRRMAAELEGGGSYNMLFPLNKAPPGLCEVVGVTCHGGCSTVQEHTAAHATEMRLRV
eukprot:gene6287-6523_t